MAPGCLKFSILHDVYNCNLICANRESVSAPRMANLLFPESFSGGGSSGGQLLHGLAA
jgi:hypothetical protein